MAIISAVTLIRGLSLFHITAAYILLTNPKILAEQNMVVVLGEALRLPATTTLTRPTEALAFASLLLLFIGVTDLTAASMTELTGLEYWSSQTPIRLVLFFAITGYGYLFKADGLLAPASSSSSYIANSFGGAGKVGGPSGISGLLINDFVFAAGFVEVCAWFYVYVLLKDDRRAVAERIAERRKAEEDML